MATMTAINTSVEYDLCVSTLSTTVITRNGGKMVNRLNANEATPMSRSERFSCITRPSSQRSENGASVSE